MDTGHHLLWLYSPLRPLLGPTAQMVMAGGAILTTEDHRLTGCSEFSTTVAAPQRGGDAIVGGRRRRRRAGGPFFSRQPVNRVDFARERVDFLPSTITLVDGKFFGET